MTVNPTDRQPLPAPPPRRRVLKLVVVLLSTGLALGAAELVLRARHPFGFRMRGNTLVLPANKVYDIRADARSRSDQLDAHILHTKNSLGFRGPEPPEDFAHWLTLVAVGGSTTECFYLSDGRTWPDRLAARLRPELRKVWIDNAGLDGHSTFGHLLLTRQALVPLHPGADCLRTHHPISFIEDGQFDLGIEEVPMAEPVQTLRFPEREDGGAWPAQGEWTYEDYLRLPDDGRRYEVVRGVLYVSAAPTIPHQFTVGELHFLLLGFVKAHDLGMVLPGPVDIKLPPGIATPVQPDLVFLRADRKSRPRGTSFDGVPDLIIEVLSPRTRRVEQTVKLAAYRDAGVSEYWLADPLAHTVVLFGLSEDGKSYLERQRAGAGETVSSVLLPGFQVALDDIFLPE